MVNVNKLRGKMVEKQLTVDGLSEKTGINRATIYRRFNNPEEFTIGEADAITTALELNFDEATAIFFNQFVA